MRYASIAKTFSGCTQSWRVKAKFLRPGVQTPSWGGSELTLLDPSGNRLNSFNAPKAAADLMRITPAIDIDELELEERFVRSSGPGGQNVNKVSTAVELRFNLAANTSIPDYARAKLKRLAGHRLTLDGVIIIQADRFRSQEQNRSDARERLRDLIAEALIVQKKRIKTKPSRSAKERRVDAKTTRGHVKKLLKPEGGVGLTCGEGLTYAAQFLVRANAVQTTVLAHLGKHVSFTIDAGSPRRPPN